ncbi:hypothetical protein MPER_16384, partial [Moniliophthora perniciosa FA553]
MKNLVQHLHDFARETSITTDEWMGNPNQGRSRLQSIFSLKLERCAQTSGKILYWSLEFILLSDSLGLSALVDAMNNAKPLGATEGTVLGPFFTEDAHD